MAEEPATNPAGQPMCIWAMKSFRAIPRPVVVPRDAKTIAQKKKKKEKNHHEFKT